MCPRCARKLFHKKIEALRRQRVEQAERDRRRDRKRASLSPDERGAEDPPSATPTPHAVEGHELVMQAVQAAGGGTGSRNPTKRSRQSQSDDASGVGAEAGKGRGGSEVEAPPAQDDAVRKAWAGEAPRDRTVEDEMDDYLSSLLL